MENKLFSISMPNYNKGKYIQEAIESVINQTYENWELIIVDDCSTDNSLDIINSFSDKRIRLFRQNTTRGVSNAHLVAFEKAEGGLIGMLDSDDVLCPLAIELMAAFAEKNSTCGLLYSNYFHCNEDFTEKKLWKNRYPKGGTILNDNHAVSHFKVFRKTDYEKSVKFDPKVLIAADRDITLKMEEVTGLAHLDEALYYYRCTKKGISTRLAGNHLKARKYFDIAIKNARKRRGADD